MLLSDVLAERQTQLLSQNAAKEIDRIGDQQCHDQMVAKLKVQHAKRDLQFLLEGESLMSSICACP